MDNLALFLPTCFALNMAFGPNNLLALTNGASVGITHASIAGIGRILAFAPMIAITAAGMGVLLATSATAFTVLKLIGAAYLIWLGIKLLRSRSGEGAMALAAARPTLAVSFRREALVALGNPKAILIFVAFFPQFVSQDTYWSDYLLAGSLFLVLELVALIVYAAIGQAVARMSGRLINRFQQASGAGMILFGILLLFTHRPASA